MQNSWSAWYSCTIPTGVSCNFTVLSLFFSELVELLLPLERLLISNMTAVVNANILQHIETYRRVMKICMIVRDFMRSQNHQTLEGLIKEALPNNIPEYLTLQHPCVCFVE